MVRSLIVGIAAVLIASTGHAEALKGTLLKQEQCECCEAHAEYLVKEGFDIEIKPVNNLAQLSVEAGVPPGFQGCHIIKLNGYVFEGHLTGEMIRKFLAEQRSDAVGLSLPGMPNGVPGMEGERTADAYPVYLIKKDGTTETYGTQ